MTGRHKIGFIRKCAEYGIPSDRASYIYKKGEENGFWNDAWDSTKDAFNKTVDNVGKDWFNNGAVPGVIGAAGGALLYNTLLKDPDDSSSSKRRKMLLYSLLGAALSTGAKAHGYGDWMPEFSFERTK